MQYLSAIILMLFLDLMFPGKGSLYSFVPADLFLTRGVCSNIEVDRKCVGSFFVWRGREAED